MSTQILITDLCAVKHNGAKLEVCHRKTKLGFQGYVKVTYSTGPKDAYKVPCDVTGRLDETDACADAIALRKDMIAQNSIGPRT